MLAISSGTETLIIYVAAAVIGAAILGFARAVMKYMQTRQTRQRQDEMDDLRLSEFLFGSPYDPKTGVPAREGWTTKTDRTLDRLTAAQEETSRAVSKILYELTPNGGHNFRGVVEKNAKAAEAEAGHQVTERARVQKRDRDGGEYQ